MTREEKIEAIYKEMANKELTFGCKLQVIESVGPIQGFIFDVVSEEYKVLWDDRRISTETKNTDFSVVGHPVMIGDVLDWIDNKMGVSNCEYEEFVVEEANISVLLWREYLKPIEEQSDDCVDYVYSLISKGNE